MGLLRNVRLRLPVFLCSAFPCIVIPGVFFLEFPRAIWLVPWLLFLPVTSYAGLLSARSQPLARTLGSMSYSGDFLGRRWRALTAVVGSASSCSWQRWMEEQFRVGQSMTRRHMFVA